MDRTTGKNNVVEVPVVLVVGVILLIIRALIELRLAVEVIDMTSAAWGFSGIFSFGAAFIGGPFWLASGICCLLARKKSGAEKYQKDLTLVGVLNIVGIIFLAFSPLLYRMMLLAVLVYYGVVFGALIHWSYQRRYGGVRKDKKKMSVKHIVIGMIAVVVVGWWIFAIYDGTMGSGAVRRQWQKTALAKSSVFEVTELKDRATDDTIYLQIEGVEAVVGYICRGDGICYYHYEPSTNSGRDSLGAYFWQKNQREINKIIAKYDGKLEQWTSGCVYVYDRSVINDFIRDLLVLPEMRKLYEAYVLQGGIDALSEYGQFFLDVRDGEKDERVTIFERAKTISV